MKKFKVLRKLQKLLTLISFIYFTLIPESTSDSLYEGFEYNEEIKNPCKLAKQRKLAKDIPVIRVIDETGENQDILLGNNGGTLYYMLSMSTQRDVVIECSSSLGDVDWAYKGRGASSGFKIVSTKWTTPSKDLKILCYSSTLVISNITDQLVGEYTCKSNVLSKKSNKPSRATNSFILFVPQPRTYYFKQGDHVNISVSNWSIPAIPDPIILPCRSKTRRQAGLSLYLLDDNDIATKIELGFGLKYNPFVGFELFPTKDLFNKSNVVRLQCRFDNDLPSHKNLTNTVLLNLNLFLKSDEKLTPEKFLLKSSSPYLSWTTKRNPLVRYNVWNSTRLSEKARLAKSPSILLWEQLFTKNDYEEYSSSAPKFHLGSVHLLNLTEGSKGTVRLYERNGITEIEQDNNEDIGLIHKWEFDVLDKINEDISGLRYEFINGVHVFTCISATENQPNITIKDMTTDELESNSESNGTAYSIVECPKDQSLGCLILSSIIPLGEVTCIGDGVDRTMRYPINSLEPSTPFFIERGERIHVQNDDIIVTLPCLPNTPEAQFIVNLFKKTKTGGWERIWQGDEPTESIEFWPNWGFQIDTSNPELGDPSGEYLCTSSRDPDDKSDAVIITVGPRLGNNIKVVPQQFEVHAELPYSFHWEGAEELLILEKVFENFTTVEVTPKSSESEKLVFKGNLTFPTNISWTQIDRLKSTPPYNITLARKKDQSVVHTWQFFPIAIEKETASGLTVDTEIIDNTLNTIRLMCQSKSDQRPNLRYYFCQNPSSCNLMKRCSKKNCNADNKYELSSSVATNLSDLQGGKVSSCSESKGCIAITLKSVPLNGFLKVFCIGDGVNEQKTISDVFFREYIHWDTTEDQDLIHLYVNLASSTDQNPQREIQSIGSNLDWEIGESVLFSCAAAPFLFSNGIKWAIENKDGTLMYQKDNIFDAQFKFSGPTQILSTFTLVIDSFEIQRIFCFVPTLSSPVQWRNISQPIFIRPEIDENCHEFEPSIRLHNVYPPLSKVKLDLADPRLDKIPYFLVPEDVKQFAVKITTPEPVEWIFSGFGNGPSLTPLIQSDRQITDFYDISTYCYTSKLLVNLRNRSSLDTGRYVAKYKYHPDTFLSFYLFVPSHKPPYLLRSGSEINETWRKSDKPFHLPCLVNNPKIPVELFRKNVLTGEFEMVNSENYDPILGFPFNQNKDSEYIFGTFKCIALKNQDDYVIVNVQQQPEKKGELKYERVGEIHIFTCISSSQNQPSMNFTEIPVSNLNLTVDSDSSNEIKFTTKECPDGCLILMTTRSQGKVHCVGDGIDESYKFPTDSSGNARKDDKKTGLWFDSDLNAFKCQTNSERSPKLVAVTCRRPNECKIMQDLLKHEGDTSQSFYSECGLGCGQLEVKPRLRQDWPPNWFSLFIRCKGDDNMEIFSQYFHDKNITSLVTKDTVEKFRRIRMDVVSFRKENSSVHATFRCFANRYFYSRGFHWALERINGAIVFQDTILTREIEVQNFGSTMSEIVLDFDEKKYKAVFCFVPLIDSSKWANSTLDFPINKLIYNF